MSVIDCSIGKWKHFDYSYLYVSVINAIDSYLCVALVNWKIVIKVRHNFLFISYQQTGTKYEIRKISMYLINLCSHYIEFSFNSCANYMIPMFIVTSASHFRLWRRFWTSPQNPIGHDPWFGDSVNYLVCSAVWRLTFAILRQGNQTNLTTVIVQHFKDYGSGP